MSYYSQHREERLAYAREYAKRKAEKKQSKSQMAPDERRIYMHKYYVRQWLQSPEAHERYKERQRALAQKRYHSPEAIAARGVKRAWRAQTKAVKNKDVHMTLYPASALYQISDGQLHYFSATKWNTDGTPFVYSRTLTQDVVDLLNTTRIVKGKRVHMLTECEMQAINRWVIYYYMHGDETLNVTYRSDDRYMIQGITPGIKTYAASRTRL